MTPEENAEQTIEVARDLLAYGVRHGIITQREADARLDATVREARLDANGCSCSADGKTCECVRLDGVARIDSEEPTAPGQGWLDRVQQRMTSILPSHGELDRLQGLLDGARRRREEADARSPGSSGARTKTRMRLGKYDEEGRPLDKDGNPRTDTHDDEMIARLEKARATRDANAANAWRRTTR